jgi:hypothetical protein
LLGSDRSRDLSTAESPILDKDLLVKILAGFCQIAQSQYWRGLPPITDAPKRHRLHIQASPITHEQLVQNRRKAILGKGFRGRHRLHMDKCSYSQIRQRTSGANTGHMAGRLIFGHLTTNFPKQRRHDDSRKPQGHFRCGFSSAESGPQRCNRCNRPGVLCDPNSETPGLSAKRASAFLPGWGETHTRAERSLQEAGRSG